jgi:hypothetical protein
LIDKLVGIAFMIRKKVKMRNLQLPFGCYFKKTIGVRFGRQLVMKIQQ